MKKRKIVLPILLCIILCFAVLPFSACRFNNIVAKASKKLNTYTINASYDDEKKTITAKETVECKFSEDRKEICFNLYGRAFRENAKIKPYSESSKAKCFPSGESFGNLEITNVLVNEVQTNFSYGGEDENLLVIEKNIKKGEKVKIAIEFTLSLANTTHRLGYYDQNVNLGNWYPILCVYENGEYIKEPYYAVGDPFYSDCANYKVSITYPEKYTIGTTGTEKTTNSSGNKTTVASAKAVRDFAIILCEKFVKKSVKYGETTINYLGYQNDSDVEANLETAKRALKTFNELFGIYPYHTLTVAKTPFLFGGMEYPNLVWIADNITDKVELTKVIVHEIAHQWWYGVVGNNEIDYSYLDEAMAEYSTAMFFENNSAYGYSGKQMVQDAATSYELYSEVIASIKGKINEKINQPTTAFATEYEYVYVIYVRGTLFLDALREKVGTKDFFTALKKYYKKYKFTNATRDNFVEMFSKVCGSDISDFFAEWNA